MRPVRNCESGQKHERENAPVGREGRGIDHRSNTGFVNAGTEEATVVEWESNLGSQRISELLELESDSCLTMNSNSGLLMDSDSASLTDSTADSLTDSTADLPVEY